MAHASADEHDEDGPVPPEVQESLTAPAVLVREGWLTKKGGNKVLGMTSWKKRFFQMSDNSIAYFEKAGGAMKGGILLETVQACRPATNAECSVSHGFIIATNQDRTYVMHAATDDERDAWITAIITTVTAYKTAATADHKGARRGAAAATQATPGAARDFDDVIEIGYWRIRGLGASLRMMCYFMEYAKVEFPMYELRRKPEEEGGGWDGSQWFSDGAKFGLAKQNALIKLPYIVNKDTKQVVTQSHACIMYLARRFHLLGNDEETTANEQLLGEIAEMSQGATQRFYSTDTPEDYEKYYGSSVAPHCQKLRAWLEQRGSKFLVASTPMAADFRLFEVLDQLELVSREVLGRGFLSTYPRLLQYHTDFRAIPQLQPYFASDFHRLPLNNKTAMVGGVVLDSQAPPPEDSSPGTSKSPNPLYDLADPGPYT